jgi:hypothetical protein
VGVRVAKKIQAEHAKLLEEVIESDSAMEQAQRDLKESPPTLLKLWAS